MLRSGHAAAPGRRRSARKMRPPWARFSAWLECVCVVTFDLELGQALEAVYPQDVKLTEKEVRSTAHASYPDVLYTFPWALGDTQFSFRLRQSVGRGPRGVWFEDSDAYNRDAPVTMQASSHLYGYVYFRQVKDDTVKRGYFQKSVVLVSRLPLVRLFQSVLQVIAPEYFKLEPCLEEVCHEIDKWPTPTPGHTLLLPCMGEVIKVSFAISFNNTLGFFLSVMCKCIERSLRPAPLVLPSCHEQDFFQCFQSMLVHVQMLWELMLLGEPVVVMAPSPAVCSETVLALVSSVAPLKYCCDFRPYFTIHDSEFKEYTTRTQAPPSVILGVTNPFFLKTFQCWPHVIRLGELKMSVDLPKQLKMKKLAKLKTLDAKPGVYTAYKTFLHKDKALVRRLLKGIQRKRPSEVQSAILRRYLLELTQSFIIPLERYLVSLMPLQRSISPWKTPPPISPFNQEEFIATLEHAGPQLTSVLKGDWLGLYRRFFRSVNFDGWYRLRHREMTQKVESLHLQVICDADLLSWTRDKSEVEIVDLILKLREKLVRKHMHVCEFKLLEKLELSIQSIISSLPQDLQALLHRD
uniref:UDENN domain-containing protein n=1 Tax=Denticeps clupeoides TaxID=299321 RepID=A0AAY4DUU7_9TELE